MMPILRVRTTRSIGIVIVTAALVFLAACQSPTSKDAANKSAQPDKPAQPVSVENGQTILTLDKDDQAKLGITVSPLQETSSRRQMTATAVVLPVQDLATLRNSYVTALATLEKARANLDVSQKEYERLNQLYRDNQNVSKKTLQAQEGLLRASQADVHAAEEGVGLQRDVVRQQWGPVVGEWLVKGSSLFDRIVKQQVFLTQTTFPAGTLSKPPEVANLRLPDGSKVRATLVSPFPRTDPRIQGISFLYLTRADRNIAPGLNLVADMPVGRLLRGVLIPQPATVWLQGQLWVYQQTALNRFTRRLVPTNVPLSKGWFVDSGFAVGEKVVMSGAQLLLSEESRPPTAPSGAGDTD